MQLWAHWISFEGRGAYITEKLQQVAINESINISISRGEGLFERLKI